MRPSNIVLTGFMGTGKTTVGRLLADRLGMGFVDTDQVIESRHGPIAEIFAEQGETRFREIERELALELAGRTGLVIATGGRMLLDPANLEALGRHGMVFSLLADPGEIHRRISGQDVDRPLLEGGDVRGRIVELLAERSGAYARFTQVTTDDRDPMEVVDELVGLWLTAASGGG